MRLTFLISMIYCIIPNNAVILLSAKKILNGLKKILSFFINTTLFLILKHRINYKTKIDRKQVKFNI